MLIDGLIDACLTYESERLSHFSIGGGDSTGCATRRFYCCAGDQVTLASIAASRRRGLVASMRHPAPRVSRRER